MLKKLLTAGVAALTLTGALVAQDHENAPEDVRRLHGFAAAVSADNIEKDIKKLVGFGTRHTLSDTKSDTRGIGAARRWIEAEFNRISEGCVADLEVYTVSDTVSGGRIPEPTEVVNVIAVQRGILDPDRIVIMSGDIDSRVSDVMNSTDDSPGANDNASGMAGTIEAARVLCQTKFPGTIVYAGLSGEEQGLYGGRILADHAKEQGWRIMGVLNNDMIGNIEGINGVIDNTTARVFSEGTRVNETPQEARQRRFWGGEVDSPSRNIARLVDKLADKYIPNLDVMMVYRLDRFRRGGHHRPFNEAGWPGVRIMETNENYNRQHQDIRTENGIKYGDTIDGVDFDYARKLTALNVVTLATFAGSPPFPVEVTIEGAVQPSTTVKWNIRPDVRERANLRGFRVYWRLTTDAQWRWSRFVGRDARELTLDNVVIDNYLFGVAAVANDGIETPVVFPGSMGRFDVMPTDDSEE
ncbi:M28 family metallopeptidase [Kordiimonas sp. SCSIO 12603]|uniref:M28 family metallopeptidase n=1 Tax=Kordiimonas sp. SCSIO 12603 TaxID=2829596 RepID=UPI002103C3EE|nr:M28 family metallopeptidase [Kordiimonas sp. SCSIO 12603]UTW57382.1 M28 family metallopeptidase [Kordiimonas sp. SCSIO 12603]